MSQHAATPQPSVYSIEVLMDEGFSRRTIRWYITIGVLPHAEGRGRTAYYTDTHLAILRRIKKSRDVRKTLVDVREEAHRSHKHAFPKEKRV